MGKCRLKPKIGEGLSAGANPIYECVTPMRCSFIKEHCPDNWEVMIRMEQHAEQRKYDPIYPVNQVLNDYFQGTIQDQKYSFFRLFGLLSFPFQKSGFSEPFVSLFLT